MQYVGHSQGGSAHAMYGREPLGLPALKERVVDRIDWQKYCGWSLDFDAIYRVVRRFEISSEGAFNSC